MRALTVDEVQSELAALPGYCMLTARNILVEATKNPYVLFNDGTLFIAHVRTGGFLLAGVKRDGPNPWPDGAAFAALLNEAKAAGASFPGWANA